jgi:hypothetical protein
VYAAACVRRFTKAVGLKPPGQNKEDPPKDQINPALLFFSDLYIDFT